MAAETGVTMQITMVSANPLLKKREMKVKYASSGIVPLETASDRKSKHQRELTSHFSSHRGFDFNIMPGAKIVQIYLNSMPYTSAPGQGITNVFI